MTGNDTTISLTYQGSVFPLSSPTDAAVTLTIRNLDTGEFIFDIYDYTPPIHPGLNGAEWNNQSWTSLLTPGNYVLSSEGHPAYEYSPGGGSHRSAGGGSLHFNASFATTAPSFATAPAPSTAALLTLLPVLGFRRRR